MSGVLVLKTYCDWKLCVSTEDYFTRQILRDTWLNTHEATVQRAAILHYIIRDTARLVSCTPAVLPLTNHETFKSGLLCTDNLTNPRADYNLKYRLGLLASM